MFYKRIIALVICAAVFLTNVYCAELTVELTFPRKSNAKAAAPKAILKPMEVSGDLTLDVTPYPAQAEQDRYAVQYYLNEQLLYETSGFDENNPQTLSFRYVFDTTRFNNGTYKLIVNFYDKSGAVSAIGSRNIIIKN